MAATATDEKIAADLAAFRGEVTRDISDLRADLAGFRGKVETDLRWIKGIGVALLLAAFSFAGYVIADLATVKADVRQLGDRLDRTEKQSNDRFDRLEKKLDTLIERTAPKTP